MVADQKLTQNWMKTQNKGPKGNNDRGILKQSGSIFILFYILLNIRKGTKKKWLSMVQNVQTSRITETNLLNWCSNQSIVFKKSFIQTNDGMLVNNSSTM